LKEDVDFLFNGHPVLSLHSPLLSIQALSVKEIAEAEFGRRGSQVPEVAKSDDLLRIMKKSCVFAVFLQRAFKATFFQHSFVLAKEVLLDSFAVPRYDMDNISPCIFDQVVFFSQLPNLP